MPTKTISSKPGWHIIKKTIAEQFGGVLEGIETWGIQTK
jgi:hypothetical protein